MKTFKLATHSGTFHADESLAAYMLRLLPQFKNASLTRSRDPEVLESCDIIFDVSGKYDGVKYFDHHQRGFSEVFSEDFSTKLSSAGLIYKHFGKEIIAQIIKKDVSDPSIPVLYKKIYAEFIEAIDANDNGIAAYPDDIKSAFKTKAITLPSIVATLNPLWTEESNDEILDSNFEVASKVMGTAFQRTVESYGLGWWPAKSVVVEAFEKRSQYDPEGRILVLEQFVPWKEHLYTVEKEQDVKTPILYVLYSDGKGWRVQAVSVTSSSFESRKALPEAWRGVRDDELSELTGIPGCVFVHAAGFIGGNQTKEGALEMAKKAL